MSGKEAPRSERIRALIEEVDRVCRESEAITNDIDRAMKREAFWPERRKSHRSSSEFHGGGNDAA